MTEHVLEKPAVRADDPAPRKPARRGRGPGRGRARWLAVVPFFAFLAVAFGLPAGTMAYGAFTATDPATGATRFTTDNVTGALSGVYAEGLAGSVRLSLTTALLATVVGAVIAQALVASGRPALRRAVVAACGVFANFSGAPLAFAFIATLGTTGTLTRMLSLESTGFSVYTFTGLVLAYLYFMVPLMVVTVLPAFDGLRVQWREAAASCGATRGQFWRHVGLPVLTPSLLGGAVLMFGTAFASHATAAVLVGGSVQLITIQIANALNGNVLAGQENLALAMSLNMVVVALLVMAVQIPLQRRSARWLG
ncbi:ABC transporter permease subunit [Streptomyces sp. B-S-A8]|uniref:ABC transporter permease subunit n=1 Tax=Streptomyces solicavernae TaxID=3043614 RepID=A0ABT6RZT9_9ACTN|nr:ABC transporter permease subunit [Streptomyces sp. B-S-A8]MDI3389958.1 ABC transporter permease subunit [Streptomyces sp. B-S-A8]